MIEERVDKDLKAAMLAKDSTLVSTLRSIKSSILYYKISNGKRDQNLSDSEVITLLSKEAKKRQESADLYRQGNDNDRADQELKEKEILDSYLPEKMDLDELKRIVIEVVNSFDKDKTKMGAIISEVKNKTNGGAEGSEIARLVKESLDQ